MPEQRESILEAPRKLFAGTSEVVITPPVGVPLLGCIQRSNGVHDDLFARALVLGDGVDRVALVCLDLIGLEFGLADELREAIRLQTGISHLLLNCSHTHSAPFTIPWSIIGWRTFSRESQAWRNDLVTKVTRLVGEAAATATEAVLRVGRAPGQIGFNRRFPTPQGILMKAYPQGTVVPWVDVLRVDGTNGKTIAVLFSHAAHPVIVHGASRLISADYPGYAVRKVQQHFGGKTLAMFAQACGANINGEPLRGGFEAAEQAGVKLGEAAIEAATQSQPLPQAALTIQSVKAALPIRGFPLIEEVERALRAAEAQLARSFGSLAPRDDQLWDLQDQLPPAKVSRADSTENDVQPMGEQPWWHQDTVLCLSDLIEKARRGEKPSLRFEVTALSVGDAWCLLAMTHELFAEYQLWFEHTAPFHHKMTWAYTNGGESYVPTDQAFPEGGYEAAVIAIRNWQDTLPNTDVPFYPNCPVGWDDSPRYGAGARMVTQRTPDQYERLLRAAQYFSAASPAKPKIIFLSAWNEWTEDHYLLPDTVFGYSYLEAVKRVFRS